MSEFILKLGDENPLADALRKAIGVGPYDEVVCMTPQFERTDSREIFYFPQTVEQYDRLKTLNEEMLREVGLQPWGEHDLWLFPHEWYNYIPEGYELMCITGELEPFKKGETDNDMRCGCLAYGVAVPPV